MSRNRSRSRSRSRSGHRRRRRLLPLAMLGALAGAIAAKTGLGERIASRISGGPQVSPEPPAAPTPPAPSNYDLSGPADNTSTPVPAPVVTDEGMVDEDAEVAAAAAEAAGIGGEVTPYASDTDLSSDADEAIAPLMESGEGVGEGLEQAEAEQVDAASAWDAPSPYERQIDETIEQQGNPFVGERGDAFGDAAAEPEGNQTGDPFEESATGASSPGWGKTGEDDSAAAGAPEGGISRQEDEDDPQSPSWRP